MGRKWLVLVGVVVVIVVIVILGKNIIAKSAMSTAINAATGLRAEIGSMKVGVFNSRVDIEGLPPQLAALNNMCINSTTMAVEAALSGDRDLLYWAVAYDPLTAAALSLQEIRDMVDELFEKEKHLMPQFEG